MSARNLSEYRKLIHDAQSDIWKSIKSFGELLVSAKKDLSAMDWETLWAELRQDHTKAELDAAIAVGDGGLDERLFPSGVAHSKVMNMLRTDQDRLLSQERFRVYSDRSPNVSDAESKTWAAMSREQRGRLISDKGGRILPLSEQRPPRTTRRQHIEIYLTVSYHEGDSFLTLRNGDREGRIDMSNIRHSLSGSDIEALSEALAE